MTSVPNPPYPIILDYDQYGKPVRLTEASAIFVSSIVVVNLSAASYAGLAASIPGTPGGQEGTIQVNKGNGTFEGYQELQYDESLFKLSTQNINVSQDSILNYVEANNLSSLNVNDYNDLFSSSSNSIEESNPTTCTLTLVSLALSDQTKTVFAVLK